MKNNKILKLIIIAVLTIVGAIMCNKSLATEGTYRYIYEPETKISELKRLYLELYSENIEIYNENSLVADNACVATGMKLKRPSLTQTIILVGDVNKDGRISATDLSLISRHIVGNQQLTGDALKAADINIDGKMNSTDISAMKMLLVELQLKRGEPIIPTIRGDIIIETSNMNATKEIEISVKWPEDEVVGQLTKEISLDGGKTFQEYTGPVKMTENGTVIARLLDENGNVVKTERLKINNIDNMPPEPFEITATSTSTTVTVFGFTTDSAIDADGNVITDGIAGIAKYMYKISDGNTEGEWQDFSIFTKLKPQTTYNVWAKAIDFAGNETISGPIDVTTTGIISATDNIKFSYNPTEITNKGVTASFTLENQGFEGFALQYQIADKSIENWEPNENNWVTGNSYIAEQNCEVYVRVVNEEGETSGDYAIGNINNIDKLAPLEFTPKILTKEGTILTIQANGEAEDGTVEDAPEDRYNVKSGEVEYFYRIISQDGTMLESISSDSDYKGNYWIEVEGKVIKSSIPEPTYTFEIEEGKEYAIYVIAYDKAGNYRNGTVISTNENFAGETGSLGIGNFNNTESNVTVNGGAASAYNPLVPVGFKAVETADASWAGVMPVGYNDGLVIEDENGNQFVWVPVPVAKGETAIQAIDNMMYDSRSQAFNEFDTGSIYDQAYYVITGEDLPKGISNEEITTENGKYSYRTEIVEEVEKNQGFYVARYEAGNANGILASTSGVMPINGITYDTAKKYAEGMYQTPYVTSSLITGTQWDLMANWIGQKIGWEALNNMGTGAEAKGNTQLAEFTFTGKYQEGPYYPGELIGEIQEGTDINKKSGDRMLIATGLVEKFKLNNIYDLYGNVWEYTTEIGEAYITQKQTGKLSSSVYETGHYARGTAYADSGEWGIYYRGMATDTMTVDNKAGFRVVLFLRESKATKEDVLNHNTTINGGIARYNNPVVPAGFKPVDTANANWGDGTTPAVDWNNGLVIEDTKGNQFVWVPVDGTNVTYETWTEGTGSGYSYADMENSDVPSGWDENGQITRYGGFYIARYEASIITQDNKVAQSKLGTEVATNISYNEAKELAERIETKDNVKISIITGKQWDTTLKWLVSELGEDAILVDSSSIGNYSGKITETGSNATKNIYDLAGNAWEWTSENYDGKKVYRGGVATATGETSISYRGAYNSDLFDEGTSFRMALFVTGSVSGIAPLPVESSDRLEGGFLGGSTGTWEISSASKKNSEIKIEAYPGAPTSLNVTLRISTLSGTGTTEYQIGGTNGAWTTGNSVIVDNNTTVYARLSGSQAILEFPVSWIDRQNPVMKDVQTQVNGNSVTISGRVEDNLAIGQHQVHVWLNDDRYFTKMQKDGSFAITISNLNGNTPYKVLVTTWDAAENGCVYETNITTGDIQGPNSFTPIVTTSGTSITIQANTASAAGIKEYQYYIDSTLVYTGANKYVAQNLTAGKTYSIWVVAVDENGNKISSEPQSVIVGNKQLNDGTYVKAQIEELRAPTQIQDIIKELNGKSVTVQLESGAKTKEQVLLDFFDTVRGMQLRVVTVELVDHTTIISGSGTLEDPYISDGKIRCNIYR